MESFGNANLLGSIASFVTQLNNCDTWEYVRSEVVVVLLLLGSQTSFYGSTNDVNQILIAKNGRSVVSHQIYRVIYVHIDSLGGVQQLRGQVYGWEERQPDQPIPASNQGKIQIAVLHHPMGRCYCRRASYHVVTRPLKRL